MPIVRRSRRVVRLAAAAIAAAVVLTGCGGDPPQRPSASLGTAVDRSVPAAIRDLAFTTSTGAHLTLDALRGKIVVFTDFLTLCGEECPMTSANMSRMAQTVSQDGLAGKVVFLEFTVDPQRDTPARLAAYRDLYGTTSNWMLLTTTPTDLQAFCKFFGIFYEKTKEDDPPDTDWLTGQPLTYDVAHQDALVFLDTKGHERFLILGDANTDGAAPPATLDKFLDEEGQQNLASPGPMSWSVPQALGVVGWLLGKTVAPSTQ